MKRLLAFFLVFLIIPSKVFAADPGYLIESFDSQIKVNQDTSLEITERIEANFLVSKHGIFRIVPTIYSYRGKTINSRLKVVSVTDESNQSYQYSSSRYSQSVEIKIGDPDKTITGKYIYIVKYLVKGVLLQYDDHDEIYWNITGHEWDTEISKTTATIKSPFAKITKIGCFSGRFGTEETNCSGSINTESSAGFKTALPINYGDDFTIVVALEKNSQLVFPGTIEKTGNFLADNWGYPVALVPFLFFFYLWYIKGRDIRYLSDNIYVKNKTKNTKTVAIFARNYLPSVYSPIDNLTPSEAGTIIDQKVDTHDIVAEIIELARLGFIKIKKTEVKKLIKKVDEYEFERLEKDKTSLKDHQKYLLEKIFVGATGNKISLSDLKNKFYKYLPTFRKKL